MKIYLAAPYAGRDIVREDVAFYEEAGHTITSEWVHGTRPLGQDTYGTSVATPDEDVFKHATMDLAQVAQADAVIHYSSYWFITHHGLHPVHHNLNSGGRHVETGYALALDMPVVVLGGLENIFQRGLCLDGEGPRHALLLLREHWGL